MADVSFISLLKVLPAVLGCAAPRFDCLALVKPQFEVGRGPGGQGRGGALGGRPPARRWWRWASTRATSWAPSVLGYASSGLPGPAGNRESFVWLAEAGRRGCGRRPGGRGAEGRAMSRPARVITVFTHRERRT